MGHINRKGEGFASGTQLGEGRRLCLWATVREKMRALAMGHIKDRLL